MIGPCASVAGVPLFLDQLVETLRGGGDTSDQPIHVEIGDAASRHGEELRRSGFTVAQVVHDYGNICQAVTELAVQRELPISTDEFRTLNRCRDLIDRTLAELRLETKLHQKERVSLAALIEEVELAAAMEARARGQKLTVTPVEQTVAINVDRSSSVPPSPTCCKMPSSSAARTATSSSGFGLHERAALEAAGADAVCARPCGPDELAIHVERLAARRQLWARLRKV